MNLDENAFQAVAIVILYSLGWSVGPILGGALTSVSFRWIFAINLPCALLAMFTLFLFLKKDIKGPQGRTGMMRVERDREIAERLRRQATSTT